MVGLKSYPPPSDLMETTWRKLDAVLLLFVCVMNVSGLFNS